MERGADLWESLLREAVENGTDIQLTKDATHSFSAALRKKIVAHIMQHGKLVIPYFGKFEVRQHKGGVTVTPPRGGSQRIDVPPYFKLYFRANQRVRHELQNYIGDDDA